MTPLRMRKKRKQTRYGWRTRQCQCEECCATRRWQSWLISVEKNGGPQCTQLGASLSRIYRKAS